MYFANITSLVLTMLVYYGLVIILLLAIGIQVYDYHYNYEFFVQYYFNSEYRKHLLDE